MILNDDKIKLKYHIGSFYKNVMLYVNFFWEKKKQQHSFFTPGIYIDSEIDK